MVAPVFCSLEDKVLDEMGHAVETQGFVAESALHPDSDSDGVHIRHVIRDNLQSVGEFICFAEWLSRKLL